MEDLALEPGTHVTVTHEQDGEKRTWHGVLSAVHLVETMVDGDRYVHVWGVPEGTDRDAKPWARVYGRYDIGQPTQGLPPSSLTHTIGPLGLTFALGTPGWTIGPVTPEGEEHFRVSEPAEHRRERLVEHLRALDPEAAGELDSVIDQLVSAARHDGRYEERWS